MGSKRQKRGVCLFVEQIEAAREGDRHDGVSHFGVYCVNVSVIVHARTLHDTCFRNVLKDSLT